jgi:DNA-binding phage protein
MADRSRVPELSGIEFTGHSSVRAYAEAARKLFRDVAHEFGFSAEELYAVLSHQKGHPLLAGVDVRLRARRVCKRLERMEQLAAGISVESVHFYREFKRQFDEAINPEKAKKPPRAFDFDDE